MVEAEIEPRGNTKKMRQMVETVEEGKVVTEIKTVTAMHVIVEVDVMARWGWWCMWNTCGSGVVMARIMVVIQATARAKGALFVR